MGDRPKISIVTPSLNQGEFLRQNLESVSGQDYPVIEQIVIDGGSTDQSLQVIREFEDGLAHWQSEKDGGQTDALIQGFAQASGEIFGWLNSDDYLWDEHAMSHVAEAFVRHPEADLVTGDLVYVSPDRRPVMVDMVLAPSPRQLRYYMTIPQPSTFWRREAYERVGGLDPSFEFCMDYDLFQRMSRGGRIVRIPHVLSAFRLHKTSKTFQLSDVCRAEEARCRKQAIGRETPGLAGKLINLGVRAGALGAMAGALIKGRKLPSLMNMRIEPMRIYALKRWDLTP